jgi:molybdopterin synthase catalytic subunit
MPLALRIVKELKRECDISRAGAILTFNGIVREWTGNKRTKSLDFNDSTKQKIMDLKNL